MSAENSTTDTPFPRNWKFLRPLDDAFEFAGDTPFDADIPRYEAKQPYLLGLLAFHRDFNVAMRMTVYSKTAYLVYTCRQIDGLLAREVMRVFGSTINELIPQFTPRSGFHYDIISFRHFADSIARAGNDSRVLRDYLCGYFANNGRGWKSDTTDENGET